MLGRTIQNQPLLSNDETNALFDVVTDYTYALDTLDNYDYQRLTVSGTTNDASFQATYDNAMQAINSLKERFGESALFGNEKDDSFKSSIGQIYQTFDGIELYPSTEEKAAMLLYHVFLFRSAFGNHQCESNEGVVGNTLASVLTVEDMVIVEEPEE